MTKVYNVASAAAAHKLGQAASALVVHKLDEQEAVSAMQLAAQHGVDLTDAALILLVQREGAVELATDDQALAQVCAHLDIATASPIDAVLRQQMAAWEAANLAPRGLPRILRRIHDWLAQSHNLASVDFWSATGGGSHLP